MKKLKLMALGLMFLMIQSAVAVTLPSTSYTPYAGGSESSEVVFSSGTMVKGSFSSLGTGEYDDPKVCQGDQPDTPPAGKGSSCEDCCSTYSYQPCKEAKVSTMECAQYKLACINACEQGPSLPLDGGLSILLALALGSGALRVFRKK